MPSKVTCPECDAVLKLPKAPAPGKKVKCPKCGAGFVPEEDLEEVSVRPAKKRTVEPKPKKKEPPKEEAKPAPVKSDDDDEGGTYAFIKEEEEEEEDEDEEDEDEDEGERKKKKKKPQIDYAPDLSVKDPRGPAQLKVMTASNLLMMNGVIGFVGWLGVLVIVLIPIVFPLRDDAATNQEGVKQGKGLGPALSGATGKQDPTPSSNEDKEKQEKPEEPWTKVAGFDLALIASVGTLIFILILLPFFLGMAYAAVIVMGGVKMQNLEGWGWGMAGSIMAMIPIHTFGLIVLSAVIVQLLIVMVLGDQDLANMLILILMGLECLSGVAIGAYVLKVLLDPEVKAGFEYVPE